MIKDLGAVILAAWLMSVPAALAGPNAGKVFLPTYALGMSLIAILAGVITLAVMRGANDRRSRALKASAIGALATFGIILLN